MFSLGDFDQAVRFLGMNGSIDDESRSRLIEANPANRNDIDAIVKKCLPDQISTVHGAAMTSFADSYFLVRVPILQGASGSACLNYRMELCGIFIGFSQIDSMDRPRALAEDYAIVLPFSMPEVVDFTARHVIPVFKNHLQIKDAWAAAINRY